MERRLAKCKGFDVGLEDRGWLLCLGEFHYDDSCVVQGLGYGIDGEFLKRFMNVFSVDRIQKINGQSCWVTGDSGKITKIEPLHKNGGNPFDIEEWAKEAEERTK